jgi:predicted ATPase
MKRIVLTGGPGAGKTVISTAIAAAQPDRYMNVPEAATQIYELLQTRWDLLDVAGRCDVQRRIYQLQLQLEEAATAAHPGKILLLDRGTIDGSAYWPTGASDYWRELGTTIEIELARYDAVIWLQTSAAIGLYDRESSNPCRFEASETAIASGEILKQLWSSHPRLHLVDAYPSLVSKVAAVAEILRSTGDD